MKIPVGEMLKSLKKTIMRFPLASTLVIIVTLILFTLIKADLSSQVEETLGKLAVTGVIMFFFSIGVTLTVEVSELNVKKRPFWQFLTLTLGTIFYTNFSGSFLGSEMFIYICLTFLGTIAFVFIAPFIQTIIQRKEHTAAYAGYFYTISRVFFNSFVIAVATLLLGFAAIAATFALFDLTFIDSGKLYGYWMVLSCVFTAGMFGLYNLPEPKEKYEAVQVNSFFSFLVRFVAIPFIYIYFIILYAYTVKVLLHFSDWPKGQVSWLVIGFSFFGYVTYMLSQVVEGKNMLISLFKKYFPAVVVPQTAMLFYAIYLRIAQYDLTMNRYFVVVFGIWLLAISVYLAFCKKKTLSYITTSFALIIVLISIGPWGVYHYPQARQYARLIHNLEIAGIYKGGTITPLKNYADIDKELSSEIYEGISYLCSYSNCTQIKNLFRDEIDQPVDVYDITKTSELSYWQITDRVTRAIHVQRSYDNEKEDVNAKYIYLVKNYEQNWFPMTTTGNATITQLQGHNPQFKDQSPLSTSIDTDTQELVIMEKGNEVERVSLASTFETLTKKYQEVGSKNLDKADMKVPFAGKKYNGELLFERLSLKNPKFTGGSDAYSYVDVGGYAIVRKR